MAITRVSNWWSWRWSHSYTVALIWTTCLFLFYSLFRFVSHDPAPSSYSSPLDSVSIHNDQRSKLYGKMENDLDEHGANFLHNSETSQSLSLSKLFILKEGSVTPLLKEANPPVRANVLYLTPKYSAPISEVVERIFRHYMNQAIWFQNSTLYHFSMFHASHHMSPVPATKEEIEAEAVAVRVTTESLCPLHIVLDRVVLTSTGVLLGCWQVNSGTDPVTIRAKLRSALPQAPVKQLYDSAILHTSFARILGPPKAQPMERHVATDSIQIFHKLVARLNNQIQGFKAVVSELWYVEEYDVLALALNGRMKVHRFPFQCSST